MDLETFVATSLVQIANGLRRANAEVKESWEGNGRKVIDRQYFMLMPSTGTAGERMVEFDVAVTATAKGDLKVGAKAGLFVADANADAGGSLSHE